MGNFFHLQIFLKHSHKIILISSNNATSITQEVSKSIEHFLEKINFQDTIEDFFHYFSEFCWSIFEIFKALKMLHTLSMEIQKEIEIEFLYYFLEKSLSTGFSVDKV